MRAATPKADTSLRSQDSGSAPVREEGLPPGITPIRPGLAEGVWREAANDALPRRAAPLPPLLLSFLVLLLDAVALTGAGMAADALTGAAGARHIAPTLLIVVLTIGFGLASGGYDHGILFSFGRQLRRTGAAATAALVVTLGAAVALHAGRRLDPLWLLAAAPLGALALLGGRAAMAGLLRQAAPSTMRRAVILGAGPQAARLAAALRRDPCGLQLLGLADERAPRGAMPPQGLPLLGGPSALFAMIRRGEVDVVVIALPWSADARAAMLLERLSAFPVEIRLAPDLLAAHLPGHRGGPLLLRTRPISGLAGLVKRAEDVVLASLALLVAAVPMLLIALAVKLDSPGPALFRQRRTGFNDQPFDVLKFRSMYAHHTDHDVRRQVLEGDPRVTKVGAILRRTSLDELPQLFNVLRGEMSFVGPRPHAPETRAGGRRFDEVVANYAARHKVKPGLTGLAQVRGWRGPTLTEEQILKRVESDLEYIDRWSPWLDFAIILRTLLAVARMRNAL